MNYITVALTLARTIVSYVRMEREARINNHTDIVDLVHDC